MMKAIIFFLLMSVVFSAYTATDYFVLDHVEAGITEGCAYYNITNPTFSVIDAASEKNRLRIDRWEVVYGKLKKSWWEELIPDKAFSEDVWVPADCSLFNGSKYYECHDAGRWEKRIVYRDVWVPVEPSKLNLQSGKTRQIRFCGVYSPEPMADGGFGVAIDHKPSFMGYVFDGTNGTPDYTWWNISYSSYSTISIPGAYANGTYLFSNDTWFQSMNFLSDLSDFVCLVNNETIVPHWVENSTADGGDNRVWVMARENTTLDCYGGCRGNCVDYSDIKDAFLEAWEPNNCNDGWTNSSHIIMNDTGKYCQVEMSDALAYDYGYWNFDVALPAEYRCNMFWNKTSMDSFMVFIAGETPEHEGDTFHYHYNYNGNWYYYYKGSRDNFGMPVTSPYRIVVGQINSSISSIYVYYENYTLHSSSLNTLFRSGAPTAFRYLSWEDRTNTSEKSNIQYNQWCFIRQIQQNFSEAVIYYGIPIEGGIIELGNMSYTPVWVQNYTIDEMVDYFNDFGNDWGAYIFAILSFGFGFLWTRKYPQTMIAGGIGCLTSFFIFGMIHVPFLAGGIICLLIGLMLKQASG